MIDARLTHNFFDPYWRSNWKRSPMSDRLDQYDGTIGRAVDEIADVIELLREDGNYALSDRLRTIAGRLARERRWTAAEARRDKTDLVRVQARGWR